MPSRAEPLRSALTRAQRTRWATPASATALGPVAFAVEAARGTPATSGRVSSS
jgi:hypothetical protein